MNTNDDCYAFFAKNGSVGPAAIVSSNNHVAAIRRRLNIVPFFEKFTYLHPEPS